MTSAPGLALHQGRNLPVIERACVAPDRCAHVELGRLADQPATDLQPTDFHADVGADQFGQRLGHALLDRLDRVLLEGVRHE